jgi:glyoxylase-like metal-dependent hydrolase (beta-lactamase superfamily II)
VYFTRSNRFAPWVAAAVLASTLAACSGPSARAPAPPRAPVTELTSSPWGFSTQSYWIEGPTGLVAVDTQFLPSEAERMIATAERQTGKKFALAVVLHANPDKFNGTATFQRHGVKVVTSKQVKDLLPSVHEKRLRAFYDRYAPDYPKELPAPESFGAATTELSAAGLTLKLHVMGAGCSEAHVALEWQDPARPARHLFVGDLVGNGVHSWLEIGKTDQWLTRLTELQRLAPAIVHPGRGKSGGPELLTAERAYLQKVIAVVAEERPTWPIPDAGLERAKAKILAAYPDHGFPVFLDIGLPAEWERQARLAR